MHGNSAQKIVDSIKQILSIYKIDFDPSFESALSSDSELDYQLLIEKTQEKIQELNERSQEILKKTGMTREQMETFAHNPDNFSPEEWMALEKIRASCNEYKKETEALIDSLADSLGESESQQAHPPVHKAKTKKNKKKNWIPL